MRTSIRAAVLLVMLVVGAVSRPFAQSAAPAPLRPAVERAAATLPAGGFVLGEVDNGRSTFAAAGRPAPRDGLPPEKIIFEIGSLTKVFTGLLLAQTVLEGKAALSDPISKHLPKEIALSADAAGVTLEQLATHTSGLPSLPTNFTPANPADPYADYTPAQLYSYLGDYRAQAPAPQPASYSNLGFGLLGHVLERIHGQSYAALVAARITGPLALADTVIALNDEQRTRFATPHSGSSAVLPWKLDTLAGAGALRSTAADLTRFAQTLLSGEHAALTAAWDLARQPRAPFGSRTAQIGLAILIAKRGDDDVYNHSGGTGGFRTYFELTPARGRATVLLLNNDSLDPAAVVMSVRQPAPAVSTDLKTRAETPLAADRLAAYPGVYAIDAQGRFTVVLDESGRPRARLTGQGFLPIFHAGADRFFARAVAAEFQFHRDAAGTITALTLHQNGKEVPAKRTATPPPVLRFPAAAKLRDFTGRFQLTPQVLIEVSNRGDTLLVKLTGQPALPVFCDAPDHFVYDVVAAALTFEREANGAVGAVTLHQNGRDVRAPRVPNAGPTR
ncbi:serine hydrolase [Horticoccus sp. 23ND18S-11]|uniref:serine hydrolase n=1 Tax=Horticoccus sp. 23ND18S-11 TaxID=3391832 RepID=UPI0039C8EBC8